ncbi:hypothetical protein CHS0354_040893 [Potamilus streckersoni]|uniref:Uncharacterized protein n=1 Tax=Potamilus streckersoni TaxID=2493646 RepID=A0AAE0VXY7_9BIVA|nr:hypothetical protein CHS0354_040893 [Potamilus streckersoni]
MCNVPESPCRSVRIYSVEGKRGLNRKNIKSMSRFELLQMVFTYIVYVLIFLLVDLKRKLQVHPNFVAVMPVCLHITRNTGSTSHSKL